MREGAEDTEQNDLPVRKAVNPAMIKDGDELDNIGGVKGAKSDDTTAPTALKDQYYHGVREVAK